MVAHKVQNIHIRKIKVPIKKVIELFSTLSTNDDKIWPTEHWPPMRFKTGLKVGAIGGHGPIRYQVIDFKPESHIEFKFHKPKGYNGTHKFEINEVNPGTTEIKHSIMMKTSLIGTLSWITTVRWLHDALLEDAFDKVENQLTHTNLKTEWSKWVKICRKILK